MKFLVGIVMSVITIGVFAQRTGIGTTEPQESSILHLESADKALLLTRVANVSTIAVPVNGMIVYDESVQCVRGYQNGYWTGCFYNNSVPGILLDCIGGNLTGTYIEGVPVSGTREILYDYATGQSYDPVSITSTGVSGLTATAPAGVLNTGSGSIVLDISGTPSSSGLASFTITIDGVSCSFSLEVNASSVSLDCVTGALTGSYVQGQPVSGNKTIHYSGAAGQPYGAVNIVSTGVSGLTATAPAGIMASGNGSIVLSINGTPSSSGTAVFTVVINGISCSFSVNVMAVIAQQECGVTMVYQEITSVTGKKWLDRNLGASQVATSPSDHLAYGSLYQWGRGNDGHQCINWTGPNSGSPVYGILNNGLSATDTPGHNLFITHTMAPYDWRSPQNNSLWQGVNGVNNPCPAGFRIPTEAELTAEFNAHGITGTGAAYNSVHKFVPAGLRAPFWGTLDNTAGSNLYMWTSTASGTNAIWRYITSVSASESNFRASGATVRCIKN